MGNFKASLAASSGQNGSKRQTAVPVAAISTPSQGVSHTSSQQAMPDLKRKRPEAARPAAAVAAPPPNGAFSQPQDTGTGRQIATQIAYAVKYLQTKGQAQTLDDLISYLSLQSQPPEYHLVISTILQRHEKVNYDLRGAGGKGTYAFRPIHNIHNGDDLLRFLQAQPTAQGLPVKELLEGWPDAEAELRKLEDAHKLLVIRNKKDDHARMVWPDDPSLSQHIDTEFTDIWHKIRLPDAENIIGELEKAGLVPTNKSRAPKSKIKAPEKKSKKPRRTGKTTNTHMLGVLRDYSHLQK